MFRGVVLVVLVGLAQSAWGQLIGPHGGQLLLDGRSQYELSRDRQTGQVIFYALHAAEPLPERLTITLYTDQNRSQTIELQSVVPNYEPYRKYQGIDPGRISAASESFSGLSLSFGIDTFPRNLQPLGEAKELG